MAKGIKLLLALLTIVGINGCATILDNDTKEVVINTPNNIITKAELNVDGNNYEIRLPTRFDVERKVNKQLNIHVTSPCGDEIIQTIPREFSPNVFANGIALAGIAIDAFTGAARRYQPDNLTQLHDKLNCAENSNVIQTNASAYIMSNDKTPPTGEVWMAGGSAVMITGMALTLMSALTNSDEFSIYRLGTKGGSTNTTPLLAGLVVGGSMYAYGSIQSSEYNEWKKTHYKNIPNIGILVNTDSGVRLHYRKEF